jgi:hypothetical protein
LPVVAEQPSEFDHANDPLKKEFMLSKLLRRMAAYPLKTPGLRW